MPAPAGSVQLTTIGSADVLLALTGPVDDGLADRTLALLDAVQAIDASHVIVDLAGAIGPLPARLRDTLAKLRVHLESGSGWLLVDGGPDDVEGSDLARVFGAYREVLTEAALPGPSAPARS